MNKVGRPPKPIKTIAKTFKITPEQSYAIDKILFENKLTNTLADRSHIVRLALENYINEFTN